MDSLPTVWPLLLASGVKWLPGMSVVDPNNDGLDFRIVYLEGNVLFEDPDSFLNLTAETYGHHPDLNDPSTRGCLLEELRRVSGDRFATTHGLEHWGKEAATAGGRGEPPNDFWGCTFHVERICYSVKGAATEGEALIRGLCDAKGVPCET